MQNALRSSFFVLNHKNIKKLLRIQTKKPSFDLDRMRAEIVTNPV